MCFSSLSLSLSIGQSVVSIANAVRDANNPVGIFRAAAGMLTKNIYYMHRVLTFFKRMFVRLLARGACDKSP